MPRIDGSNLVALIRVQLDALRQAQPDAAEKLRRRKAAAGSAGPRAGTAREPDAADSGDGLQQRIGMAVRSIPADDPDRRRKAFRAFLEAVLLHELGANLKSDPAFAAMVGQVHERMEEDETLRAACVRASDLLLAQANAAPGKAATR